MTDEEKKAVKSFKQENENDLSRFEDFNNYTQTLIKRNNIILNLIQKQQAEIEKKDKIIDLMAEDIFDYEHITYVDNEQFKKCKQKIIKKFEKKVEGRI